MLKEREALFSFHGYKPKSVILAEISSELLVQDLLEINKKIIETEFFYFNSY